MKTFKLYLANFSMRTIDEVECYRETSATYWKVGSKYSDRKETQYNKVFRTKNDAILGMREKIQSEIDLAKKRLKYLEDALLMFNEKYKLTE